MRGPAYHTPTELPTRDVAPRGGAEKKSRGDREQGT